MTDHPTYVDKDGYLWEWAEMGGRTGYRWRKEPHTVVVAETVSKGIGYESAEELLEAKYLAVTEVPS